jgi:hypothetical protein
MLTVEYRYPNILFLEPTIGAVILVLKLVDREACGDGDEHTYDHARPENCLSPIKFETLRPLSGETWPAMRLSFVFPSTTEEMTNVSGEI